MRAFGKSIGFELNGASDSPGPHSMNAWKPVEGNVAWGIVGAQKVGDQL